MYSSSSVNNLKTKSRDTIAKTHPQTLLLLLNPTCLKTQARTWMKAGELLPIRLLSPLL